MRRHPPYLAMPLDRVDPLQHFGLRMPVLLAPTGIVSAGAGAGAAISDDMIKRRTYKVRPGQVLFGDWLATVGAFG